MGKKIKIKKSYIKIERNEYGWKVTTYNSFCYVQDSDQDKIISILEPYVDPQLKVLTHDINIPPSTN